MNQSHLGTASPRIAIFIVAYNAVATLAKVLTRIPESIREAVDEIYVFDDASTDDTYLLARGCQQVHGWPNLRVVRHESNQGYGGNQKLGYDYAIARGFDYVVLLHGDGQYAPEELPRMLEPLLSGRADAVFGSRMLDVGAARKGGMPLYKYWGNKVLTRFQNWIVGASLSEWHSGYRAFSVKALASIPFQKNSNAFHFDTEIILQLLDRGYRIEEVAIPVYYGDEICHVNGVRYARDVVSATWQYRNHTVGYRNDPRFEPIAQYRRKYSRFSSHSQIARLLPHGSRVLDLGCEPTVADAYIDKGCSVVGVGEPRQPLETARLERYITQDLETELVLPTDIGRFDVIVLADVIEHLRRGEQLLSEAAKHLRPGGRIIGSTGNIAFLTIRIGLMFGFFTYRRRGVLDETHVHLYTLRSFLAAFSRANLYPRRVQVTPPPVEAVLPISPSAWPMRLLDRMVYCLARLWKELFAYQFIVEATPRDQPD